MMFLSILFSEPDLLLFPSLTPALWPQDQPGYSLTTPAQARAQGASTLLTREEARVLGYLRQHRSARATDLAHTCETGGWTEGLAQVISQLDWLGYVTVFWGPAGEPSLLQLTERGMARTKRVIL